MEESTLEWFKEFKRIFRKHKNDYAAIVMNFLIYADKEDDDINERLKEVKEW